MPRPRGACAPSWTCHNLLSKHGFLQMAELLKMQQIPKSFPYVRGWWYHDSYFILSTTLLTTLLNYPSARVVFRALQRKAKHQEWPAALSSCALCLVPDVQIKEPLMTTCCPSAEEMKCVARFRNPAPTLPSSSTKINICIFKPCLILKIMGWIKGGKFCGIL